MTGIAVVLCYAGGDGGSCCRCQKKRKRPYWGVVMAGVAMVVVPGAVIVPGTLCLHSLSLYVKIIE